jgi:NADH dehydrogenase FAD-containing subunit
MKAQKHRVVVVGGGVEAIKTAQLLASDSIYEVTLINDSFDLEIKSSIYRTAEGRSKIHIRVPLERVFSSRSRDLDLVKATIKTVIPEKRKVVTDAGVDYRYDSLIMALRPTARAVKGFYCDGINMFNGYDPRQIERFRRLASLQFEQGLAEKNYVVIGGGETGVRLATSLRQYIDQLTQRYSKSQGATRNVLLIDENKRLFPDEPRSVSDKLKKRLSQLGIQVILGAEAKSFENNTITLSNNRKIHTSLPIVTLGAACNDIYKENSTVFEINREQRVIVTSLLEAEGHNNIYVLGDSASSRDSKDIDALLYEAEYVVDILHRKKYGKILVDFEPPKRTLVMQVGPRWAVVVSAHTHYGLLAYIHKRWIDLKHFSTLLPKRLALQVWRYGTKHDEVT